MKAREPVWMDSDVVIDIHAQQLAEHGGREGIRDPGLLESALWAPADFGNYSKKKPHIVHLAAIYACRLAKNHPFVDSNKRTAAIVSETFLALNGYTLIASDDDFYLFIMGVADGSINEALLAEWFLKNVEHSSRS